MKRQIIEFIKSNGWTETTHPTPTVEFRNFVKEDCYDIDISSSEIVLVDETGDFMHIRMKLYAIYTLLGFLIHYNQITMGYNYPS